MGTWSVVLPIQVSQWSLLACTIFALSKHLQASVVGTQTWALTLVFLLCGLCSSGYMFVCVWFFLLLFTKHLLNKLPGMGVGDFCLSLGFTFVNYHRFGNQWFCWVPSFWCFVGELESYRPSTSVSFALMVPRRLQYRTILKEAASQHWASAHKSAFTTAAPGTCGCVSDLVNSGM